MDPWDRDVDFEPSQPLEGRTAAERPGEVGSAERPGEVGSGRGATATATGGRVGCLKELPLAVGWLGRLV